MNQIADEAAFCRALNIDPDHVQKGTIRIEFLHGQALLTYTSVYPVMSDALARAFHAASNGTPTYEEDGT